MGCIQMKRRPTKIVAMKTVNEDIVFTSTSNIRDIYSFEKILGHGSFGVVKLARLRSNPQKRVAVKIIDKSRVIGREGMLATEIYVLQRMDHPNIIKFYEVYQDELFLYLCMEFCEGGELLERIARSAKTLSEG
jgi:calcium-dependent protein kinase